MQNQDENNSNPAPDEEPVLEEITSELDQDKTEQQTKPRRPIGRIIGFGILAIIILGVLGALGGYYTALQDRENYADSVISTEISDQFLLGLIEFERGQYELARQRFEYILRIDPNNPAAREKLTETILKLNENDALPTAVPTPTLTPTPDSRDQAELYETALAYRDTANWTALIDTLNTLRYQDPEYNSVQIDGLFYLAYRNRGMERILVEGNLEGGIFDLNRAELYGLLDVEARNYREWSSNYITGVSFWEVDWEMVVKYFSPLAISAPYLGDSNYFTAQDRLATAQVEISLSDLDSARYSYSLSKWCDAYDLFSQVSTVYELSPEDQVKFDDARNKCLGIEPTEEP
jgi:tetratricopeptide (TPR) repeat protein